VEKVKPTAYHKSMVRYQSLLGPARKIFTTTLGIFLLLAGIVLSFTPGPGILFLLAGLAVLARDYVWADNLLTKTKQRFKRQ
jgi:uncharacterized membrane protein